VAGGEGETDSPAVEEEDDIDALLLNSNKIRRVKKTDSPAVEEEDDIYALLLNSNYKTG
jgi:hypothetical protein